MAKGISLVAWKFQRFDRGIKTNKAGNKGGGKKGGRGRRESLSRVAGGKTNLRKQGLALKC